MEVKKNKLYLYTLITVLSFTLFLGQASATEYINYYDISMTSEQYNNLLELGFSENEIYYMDEETFETNKDISAELVAKNNKYYKTVYTDLNGNSYSVEVNKDEYNNQSTMDPRGTINTEYKNVISTMSKLTNTFRYKVTVGWNRMPSTRSYDIIGIGFDDDVYISSSVYFTYTYCVSSGDCTTSTLYYDRKKLSTGGSVVYKVPSQTINSLSAVLYYDVAKNTTSTINNLYMCGDYSHATSTVTSEQYTNYTINRYGLILYDNVPNYYDAIPCADSTWGGSW